MLKIMGKEIFTIFTLKMFVYLYLWLSMEDAYISSCVGSGNIIAEDFNGLQLKLD